MVQTTRDFQHRTMVDVVILKSVPRCTEPTIEPNSLDIGTVEHGEKSSDVADETLVSSFHC